MIAHSLNHSLTHSQPTVAVFRSGRAVVPSTHAGQARIAIETSHPLGGHQRQRLRHKYPKHARTHPGGVRASGLRGLSRAELIPNFAVPGPPNATESQLN